MVRQTTRSAAEERGVAMVVLLVSISIMTVLMTMALPTWRQLAQREKEEELIFRGMQYARAVMLFQRKFPGANPPNVQVLLDQKFLRKKYKDPMTSDGEFQVLPPGQGVAGQVGGQPGTVPGRPGGTQGSQVPGTVTSAPSAQPGTSGPGTVQSRSPGIGLPGQPAGIQAGVGGVVSKSKAESIKIFNGRNHYNEWVFDVSLANRQMAPGTGGGAPQPGQTVPPGGSPLPGLGPNPGAPRPGIPPSGAPGGGFPGGLRPSMPGPRQPRD